MRNFTVLLALAALVALPGVQALENVRVAVPDASIGVAGTSQDFDTTTLAPDAPGAAGHVETQDERVTLRGSECAVDPNDHSVTKERAANLCQPGDVQADANTDLVRADLALILPSQAAPALAPAAPAKAQAVAAQPVEVSPTFVLAAAAAAGVSLAALYGIWRVLKLTGLAALLPLYSHLTDDEILDDPNRAGIYRLIQAEPGISTKDIADRLDLAWGTVTHHLGKLEKRRFVVSKKYGKYRRYFANGEGGTDRKDVLAVLRLDRTGDVAALIRSQPGVTQKAVSEALGVSSSTILWHVKRLEEVQLVTKVREGKLVRYYPGEGLAGIDIIPAVPVTAA